MAHHRALCEAMATRDEAQLHLVNALHAAESGSVLAMCIVARCLASGYATERSESRAGEWAARAAANHFAPGQYLQAHLLPPDQRDSSAARRLLEAAAESGFVPAALEVAYGLLDGRFGAPEPKGYVEYLAIAASEDDRGSAMELAQAYERGLGVARDDSVAVTWYVRAAELGSAMACTRLSMAYSFGQLGQGIDPAKAELYSRRSKDSAAL